MTDQMLERQLRGFYRADDVDDVAPMSLRAAVLNIPADKRIIRFPWRQALLAAATVALLMLGGAFFIGGGGFRLLVPPPSPSSPNPSPTRTPSSTPSPTEVTQPSNSTEPTSPPTTQPTPTAEALIAVYQSAGNTAQILTLDPDTGAQVPLGSVPIDSVQLRSSVYGAVEWSDDRRLVSVSRVTDGALVTDEFDVGSGAQTTAGAHFGEDSVSPDGSLLAGVDVDLPSVTVTNLAGDVVQQIPLPVGYQWSYSLSWAPDQSAVLVSGSERSTAIDERSHVLAQKAGDTSTEHGANVFADTSTGRGWLLIVPLNGDAIRKLGPGLPNTGYSAAEYSPDMSRIIAAQSCTSPCTPGLVEFDVVTGDLTQLTTVELDAEPTWSPDGGQIAFVRVAVAGRGIWVMNPDGSSQTRITRPQRPNREHNIDWSADGTQLLFSRGDTTKPGLGDLYIVSSVGGDPRLLLSGAVGDW